MEYFENILFQKYFENKQSFSGVSKGCLAKCKKLVGFTEKKKVIPKTGFT